MMLVICFFAGLLLSYLVRLLIPKITLLALRICIL